jgi:hypothetical protein
MAKQSLRIYIYKITFDEVPHYYYGVHKEKFFDEYYMGSPKTHKDFWELYTPKKEYIKFFEYSDEGYAEARIFEDSLIAPVLNDEFCLNEHYGGLYSLEICRKAGQKGGKIGGKIGGKVCYQKGVGTFARSKEQVSEDCKKAGKISGNKHKENKTGIFGRSPEKISEDAKNAAKICYEKGVGVHALTVEEKIEIGKKAAKVTNSQKWQCTVTGHVTNSGALTRYQKAHGIDTSNRVRFYGTMHWKIIFEDGSEIIIDKSLYEWSKENRYNYSGLKRLVYGKVEKYRDIIKVVLITSNIGPPHKLAQDP